MKRFKSCLGVFLIFFFGVIFGFGIANATIHEKIAQFAKGGPERIVTEIANMLKKELDLDEEQQESLQQIALDARIRLRKQGNETLSEAAERVHAILNPEQQKKFDDILAKGRAKWRRNSVTPAEGAGGSLPDVTKQESAKPAAEATEAAPASGNPEPATEQKTAASSEIPPAAPKETP